ncbi:Hypothetical predicted protein [Xyrichtys novacula]|uniref:Uncharacterized protein n=1 Tax=Xyrichtys novacula TaxID=13765 RepID=A0AAV1G844_XYRNO|nr:Hypothetical predicted protein [Xyrichtys novacula]
MDISEEGKEGGVRGQTKESQTEEAMDIEESRLRANMIQTENKVGEEEEQEKMMDQRQGPEMLKRKDWKTHRPEAYDRKSSKEKHKRQSFKMTIKREQEESLILSSRSEQEEELMEIN